MMSRGQAAASALQSSIQTTSSSGKDKNITEQRRQLFFLRFSVQSRQNQSPRPSSFEEKVFEV
jgi:hypothetical protein